MRFESEDAAERRCSGFITGVSDVDPIQWAGSKWRCIEVRWDDADAIDCGRPSRVSPWEIEPTVSLSGSSNHFLPGSKRTRIGFSSINAGYTYPSGTGHSDLGKSARFNKVLQGQEIFDIRSCDVVDATLSETKKQFFPEMRRCIANTERNLLFGSRTYTQVPDGISDSFHHGMGFGESVQFRKVLQGQEIVPVKRTYPKIGVESHIENRLKLLESSGIMSCAPLQGYCTSMQAWTASTQASSPSSVLMFQQSASHPFTRSFYGINEHENGEDCDMSATFSFIDSSSQSHLEGNCVSRDSCESGTIFTKTTGKNGSFLPKNGGSCMLFGIPLIEKIPVVNAFSGLMKETPSLLEGKLELSFSTTKPQLAKESAGHGLTKVY